MKLYRAPEYSPRILRFGNRRKREGCRPLYPGHETAISIQLEAGLALRCQLELIMRTFLLHCLLALQVLCCWSHTGPKWLTICNRKIQINFSDGLVHWIADMRVRCGPVKLDQLVLHIFIIIIINPIVLRIVIIVIIIIIIIIISIVNGPVIWLCQN